MSPVKHCNIKSFFIAGINYKKTDAAMRGMYAINTDQYNRILLNAHTYGVSSLFILSTCNRTEIYGFADNAEQLANLLCSETKGDAALFHRLAYIKNEKLAVMHLFNVAAGLDSQLLGDYEIVGQLKQAFKFAREHNFINNFLERLFNDVLRASKSIKNETALSDGTISVSFAAVQYIKEHVPNFKDKKIMVVGTGKIGRNTCKNLVDYLGTRNITLINRTEEKAASLAMQLGVSYTPLGQIASYISSSDIIITATNAAQPFILYAQLQHEDEKLIIDLSVPHNVEERSGLLPNIKLVNVDELSKINDTSLEVRKMEIPKAKQIIITSVNEFMDWYHMRKNAPVLKAIKLKLNEMVGSNNPEGISVAGQLQSVSKDQLIQKVLNNTAGKMRADSQAGCYYIEAINEFMLASH